MNPRRFAAYLGLFGLAFLSLGAGPDAVTEVKKFEPFVGEWTIHATWSAGNALVAHNINQWTLNGTHLSGQTWVGEGAEKYQRYQSFFSFDAKHNCLVTTSYAVDGAISTYRVEPSEDGKVFKIGFSPVKDEALPKVRQTITFTSADEYHWVVELDQNGTWSPIMDGVWKRDEPKADAK